MASKAVDELIEIAQASKNEELDLMIEELSNLGEEATAKSPEYKVLKEAVDNLKTNNVKIILKSNYDVDEDGKIVTKKPDETIEVSVEVAKELVRKAWALYK